MKNKPTTMDIIVRNTQHAPFAVLGRELSRRNAPVRQRRHSNKPSPTKEGGEAV